MDEQIMNLYNKLLTLSIKRDQIESRSYMSAFKPDKPEMDILPEIWFGHEDFNDTYEKILKEYYSVEFKCDDEKTIKKYYPNYDLKKQRTMLCEIGPKGKPDNRWVSYYYCTSIYSPASYTEINEVRDSILKERGKLFKNPFKLKNLIAKHKQARKNIAESCIKLPKVCMDRVFLKTFACKDNGTGSISKNLLLSNVGWICIPAYFFNESLYNLRSGKYKKLFVTNYINLLPEASLALITKDLQAESGETFFKQGVTVSDVFNEVKKQAEYEKKFAEKFTLEFICSLFSEKLKTFKPDPKKKKQELTIKLPYMGLDKLDDNGLQSVANQIWHYYSLIDRYNKYESWFNNYPMATYLKEMSKYYDATGGSTTVADWESQVAKVLPAGIKDVPYFDTYINAIKTNRFTNYYDLCKYVEDIRIRDDMYRSVKNIETSQKKIVAQNNVIISNQQQLYLQSERHHKEKMKQAISSHNAIMRKLTDIENSIPSEITIYY